MGELSELIKISYYGEMMGKVAFSTAPLAATNSAERLTLSSSLTERERARAAALLNRRQAPFSTKRAARESK